MTSDEDVVAERRKRDERRFLIATTSPDKGRRLTPAVNAVRALLADGEWHTHNQTLAAGLVTSDIAVRTLDNLLRRACTADLIERRGNYIRGGVGGRNASDTREWRLIEWPEETS
jgi:hypothetical protein